MNNQQVVVDKIVQNLAFEVEAVPKDKSIKAASVSQSTPLNVRIKVRKKDETHQHIPSEIVEQRAVQKVRLVNSDQTIMTFDVFMEAEFDKKPQPRKHFYDILKPGICLGSDNDDYAYMPTSSYSANITEPSVVTKSDGGFKQTFTLSKNVNQNYTVATQSGVQKWFFGKCKPGGCLDPPFSEDKYPYKPRQNLVQEKQNAVETGPLQEDSSISVPDQTVPAETVPKDGVQDNEETNDAKSNGRHSSIFDGGIFKKKRKSFDKSTNTKIDPKANETDSVLSLFQSDTKSLSAHSNPIITYPSKKPSNVKINDDKTARSRGSSEDKSRKSFNDNHSEPYFIPPRKTSRLKEQELLDTKHRPSDAAKLREQTNKPLRLPIPVPIPIPIPLPSRKHDPNVGTTNSGTNDDTDIDKIKPTTIPVNSKTGTSDELVITNQVTEDISDINSTSDQTLKIESDSENVDDKNQILTKHQSKISTPDSDKISSLEPITSDVNDNNSIMGDENVNNTRKQSDKDMDEKNNGNNKPNNTDTSKKIIPIPIPIPLPLNFSKDKQGSSVEIDVTNTSEGNEPLNDSKTDLLDKALEKPSNETESTKMEPDMTDPKKILRTMSDPFEEESDFSENEQSNTTASTIQGERPQSSEGIIIDESMGLMDNTDPAAQEKSDELKSDTNETKINPYENNQELPPATKPDDSTNDTAIIPMTDKDKTKHDSETANDLDDKSDKTSSEQFTADNIDETKKNLDSEMGNDDDDRTDKISSNQSLNSDNDENKKNVDNKIENEEDYKIDKISSDENNDDEITSKTILSDHEESARSANLQQSLLNPFHNGLPISKKGSNNFVTAPVFIDNTKHSDLKPLKAVYSETNLTNDSNINHNGDINKTSRITVDDDMTHSLISNEMIASVMYDLNGSPPSTSSVKYSAKSTSSDKRVLLNAEAKGGPEVMSKSPKTLHPKNYGGSTILLSAIPSTSTLKSAMKKETISVELGFQSYQDDKNERVFRTFDTTTEPTRMPNDTVTLIKSQIRLSSNEIRIPIDSDHDMSIQIKKPYGNQRVSISESGFVNTVDNGMKTNTAVNINKFSSSLLLDRLLLDHQGEDLRNSEVKGYHSLMQSNVMDGSVMDLYEQQLMPLHMIIKNLRDEIDVLAAQQILFRDKLYCPRKIKPPRLVHSNRRCFGCLKK